jgi:hypothetical protein
VDQAPEACCLADLLLETPGTTLRRNLAVHALSSASSVAVDIALKVTHRNIRYLIKKFNQSKYNNDLFYLIKKIYAGQFLATLDVLRTRFVRGEFLQSFSGTRDSCPGRISKSFLSMERTDQFNEQPARGRDFFIRTCVGSMA